MRTSLHITALTALAAVIFLGPLRAVPSRDTPGDAVGVGAGTQAATPASGPSAC